jgi:hypothetical protein
VNRQRADLDGRIHKPIQLDIVRFEVATEMCQRFFDDDGYVAHGLERRGSGRVSRSGPVAHSDTPQYRAFVFEGHGNDRIEVTVTGAGENAFVAVADPALKAIASGTRHLSVTLPDRGPDPETFYVVFKDRMNRQTRISVQLKKNAGAAVSTDATR